MKITGEVERTEEGIITGGSINDVIVEFEEKPKKPKSNLASMGVYVFTWDILKKYLIADENDEKSDNDFGKNILTLLQINKLIKVFYGFYLYSYRNCTTIDRIFASFQ